MLRQINILDPKHSLVVNQDCFWSTHIFYQKDIVHSITVIEDFIVISFIKSLSAKKALLFYTYRSFFLHFQWWSHPDELLLNSTATTFYRRQLHQRIIFHVQRKSLHDIKFQIMTTYIVIKLSQVTKSLLVIHFWSSALIALIIWNSSEP